MSAQDGASSAGVLDVLSVPASTSGDRPAVTGTAEAYTYAELFASVLECAAWIRSAELGAPVVLVPSSTPTDVVAILAAVVAGVCPLVADRTWTGRELAHVVESTGARGVLGRADALPDGVVPRAASWRAMTIGRWGPLSSRGASEVEGGLGRVGFGRFTSGTTGGSRCLGFTEQAAVNAAAAWREASGLTEEDTVLCLATLNNGLAFNTCLLSVLGAGARLVLHDGRPIPSSIARAVRNARPTVLVAFPFAFDALTASGRLEPGDLRLAVSSAARLAPETQRRWQELTGLGVCDYYGLVETGPVTFNDGRVPGSVGAPLPGAEITIEPAAGAQPGAGRVLVRTSSMASRYLDGQLPTLAASLSSDGFYRTNDLGFVDDSGHLHLAGRAGAVVNVAGRKIDPNEVASVIRAMDGVTDVVVRGETSSGVELLAAYVESTSVERQSVVEHCRRSLADYKLPQRIVIRAELPRSAAGKVAAARLADEPSTP